MFKVHLAALFHRLQAQIVFQPIAVAAVVGHAVVFLAEGFSDVNAAEHVEAKRHRIGQIWLGRPQLDRKAVGNFLLGNVLFAFLRRGFDVGLVGLLRGEQSSGAEEGGKDGNHDRWQGFCRLAKIAELARLAAANAWRPVQKERYNPIQATKFASRKSF